MRPGLFTWSMFKKQKNEIKSFKVERLVLINDALPTFLFGLACMLGVDFDQTEVARVLAEVEVHEVIDGEEVGGTDPSEKSYTFLSTTPLTVTGKVEFHEPHTIWIMVESAAPLRSSLDAIHDRVGAWFPELKPWLLRSSNSSSTLT